MKNVIARIRNRLLPKYGDGETRAMTRIIFENLKGWNPVELAIRQDEMVSDFIIGKIDGIVSRLLNDEPIQQIFGNTVFYGLKLKITPDTLIPRPETAELVDIIVKQNGAKDLKVLDAGTGSGCIALALSRNLVFPEITAIDISEKALIVAEENGENLHAAINFMRYDIMDLRKGIKGSPFNIVVSNPPYIAEHEKQSMDRNVLNYEPATALFVPDSDPLKFYIAILDAAQGELLSSGGKIYFEINPLYADRLLTETTKRGFNDVTLYRDTEGKNRFLYAIKR